MTVSVEMGKNNGKAGTAPPMSEKQEKPAANADAVADASLSNWLAAAKDLGSAKPQVSNREPEEEVSDDDDLDSLDERELQLARLQAEGGDWLSEFDEDDYDEDGDEGSSDEDEDEDEGEGEEYDLQPVKGQKAVEKGKGGAAAQATAQPQAKAAKSQESAKAQPQKQAATLAAAVPAVPTKPSKPAHSLTASAAPVVSAEQVAVIREQAVAGIAGTKRARPQEEDEEEDEEGQTGKAKPGKASRPEAVNKRPLPLAFAPESEARTVFLRNLPFADQQGGEDGKAAAAAPALKGGIPALVEALSSALKAYGKVSRVHVEVSNSGKQCSFGYAEFKKEEGAQAAAAATAGVSVAGRTVEILPYTPALNYRNPDGSRRKEKSKEKKEAKKAANAARMAEKQGQEKKQGR